MNHVSARMSPLRFRLTIWASTLILSGAYLPRKVLADAAQPSSAQTLADKPATGNLGAASDSPPTERTRRPFDLRTAKVLTGDWGGARTELEDKGISLKLTYQQQFQQNIRGGLDTHNAHRFSGSYDLTLSLDFGKMGLLEDSGFVMRAAKGGYSDGINPNKVGALFSTNADAGDDRAIFVNKWWLWKKFAERKAEVRVGLLQTNKDLFDISPYANHEDVDFINRLSIRNATIPHRNGIGVFAKYQPTDWLRFQAIGLDNQWRAGKTGFSTAFHDQGQFVGMWEMTLEPKWESAKGPMPGDARVGFWYDASVRTKFRDTLGGRRSSEADTGDVGYYVGADQLIWKESANAKDKQGLGAFARYGHATGDRNRVNHYWSAGLSYLGLLPDRDKDVTGFAVAQAILSERYRDEVRRLADRETVYEWYYAWQVTPAIIVSPHVQVVTNPGGDKDDRDAVIAGLRVRLFF